MEFEKIRAVIAEQMQIPEAQITPETNLVDDLDADSLDILEIVSKLEKEYDVQLQDEDIESFQTVGDAADFMKRAIESK